MVLFRHHRPTSNHRICFKPELEVLEGRILPSIRGAIDAIGNCITDWSNWSTDQNQLNIDQSQFPPPGKPIPGPLYNQIQQDQRALNNDIASWNRDVSSLWQNIVNLNTYISSGPPKAQQQPTTQQPSASWAGTYSGVLIPVDEGESGGSDPRSVTVLIKQDGSGNISLTPFEDETLTGEFRSGAVSVSAVDNIVSINLNITVSLNVTITGAGSIQGNKLSLISLDAFDGQYDYDVAVSGDLKKQ